MKKYLYLLILLSVVSLSACKKEEKMPDFIPTQNLEDDTDSKGEDAVTDEDSKQTEDGNLQESDQADAETEDKDEANSTQPIVTGKTKTMYVKLNQYGGFLNVRPNPSTEGTPVGFLVHAEAVDVIEIKNGWASFKYNGAICYVNADFLVDKQPAYLDPPTSTPSPKPTATPKPEADDEPRDI